MYAGLEPVMVPFKYNHNIREANEQPLPVSSSIVAYWELALLTTSYSSYYRQKPIESFIQHAFHS